MRRRHRGQGEGADRQDGRDSGEHMCTSCDVLSYTFHSELSTELKQDMSHAGTAGFICTDRHLYNKSYPNNIP